MRDVVKRLDKLLDNQLPTLVDRSLVRDAKAEIERLRQVRDLAKTMEVRVYSDGRCAVTGYQELYEALSNELLASEVWTSPLGPFEPQKPLKEILKGK